MTDTDPTTEKLTKPSNFLSAFVDKCPETGESQAILKVDSGGKQLVIFTRGKTTAWKHTIHTEEVNPS